MLIIFYYIGVVILPGGIYYSITYLIKKYNFIDQEYNKGLEVAWRSLNNKQKIKLSVLCLFFFLMVEIFWRMLFEFLIAYMQIRDVLLQV